MIKAIALIRRKPGISREEFKRHYEEIHAPLALRYLSFARYARNHVNDTPPLPPPDFDVASVFWYADMDQLQATQNFLSSEDYKVLAADEETFMDREKTVAFMVEEVPTELGADRSGAVKFIALLKRKSGLSLADFRSHYEGTHVPLILRLSTGIVGYCRNYTVTFEGMPEPPFDSFTEIWYRDLDAFHKTLAFWATPEGKVIRDDEDSFLDRSRIVAFLADERISDLSRRGR